MLYIAKILEENGDEVKILDFAAESFSNEKLCQALQQADVVGLTVLSFSYPSSIEIIKSIKKIKPQIKVIIGGPHCTLYPKEVLEETLADVSVQ